MTGRRTSLIAVVVAVLAISGTLIVFAVQPSTPSGQSGPHATTTLPDSPGGSSSSTWKMIFSDTFPGTSLNTAHWSTCYDWACTNAGNNELEWFTSTQVTVSNGLLTLSATPHETYGKPYVSGMISSYGKFAFTYGYAQIVAKMPNGLGMWPAFWTLPTSRDALPELDVMEKWLPNSNVHFVVHYGSGSNELTTAIELPSYADKFHTFGMDWEPGTIKWYVDGVLQATYAISITTEEYLLTTLSVAGFAPPNASVPFPQSLQVKSIKVWQHPGVGSATTN